jgi:hypothetical protein
MPMSRSPQISPPAVRYIKLGKGGAFAEDAFNRGILPLAFPDADHALCAQGNWDAVRDQLVARGRPTAEANKDVRELRDFYELPDGTLFFTTAHGHLYWAIAAGTVEAGAGGPQRERGTRAGWRRDTIDGTPLELQSLSSSLTQTAGYGRTICKVGAEDYLLRRIRGEKNPLHRQAAALRADMTAIVGRLIGELHFAEFEVLIDLIFTRGGWRRTSLLGKDMPDVDLIVEQPLTGETAWVQVKTGSHQAELVDYLRRFARDGRCDRFVFACAKPRDGIALPQEHPRLQLWTGTGLAERALAAGLYDWLIERTG